MTEIECLFLRGEHIYVIRHHPIILVVLPVQGMAQYMCDNTPLVVNMHHEMECSNSNGSVLSSVLVPMTISISTRIDRRNRTII